MSKRYKLNNVSVNSWLHGLALRLTYKNLCVFTKNTHKSYVNKNQLKKLVKLTFHEMVVLHHHCPSDVDTMSSNELISDLIEHGFISEAITSY